MLSYNYPYTNRIRKVVQSRYQNPNVNLSWEPDLTISKTMVGKGDKKYYNSGSTPAFSQPYLNANELAYVDSGKKLSYMGNGLGKQVASTALDMAPHVASLVTGLVAPEFAPVSVPVVGYTTGQLRKYVKKKTGYGIDLKKLQDFGVDVDKLTETSKKYIQMYKQMATSFANTLKKPNNQIYVGGNLNGTGILNKIKPYAQRAINYGLDMTLPKAGEFLGYFLGEKIGNNDLGMAIGEKVGKKFNKYIKNKLGMDKYGQPLKNNEKKEKKDKTIKPKIDPIPKINPIVQTPQSEDETLKRLKQFYGGGIRVYQGGAIYAPTPNKSGTLNVNLTKSGKGAKSGGRGAKSGGRKISDKMVRRNKKIKELMTKNHWSLQQASKEIKEKNIPY